jgi:hypothetical protein
MTMTYGLPFGFQDSVRLKDHSLCVSQDEYNLFINNDVGVQILSRLCKGAIPAICFIEQETEHSVYTYTVQAES